MTTSRAEEFRDGNPTLVVQGSSGPHYISKGSTQANRRDTDWSCDCMDWIIRKNDNCKHLRNHPTVLADRANRSRSDSTPAILATPFTPAEMEIGTQLRNKIEEARVEASDKKKLIREKRDIEKAERLSVLRHGFQLAKTLTKSEWKDVDYDNSVFEVKYDGELGMLIDGTIINRSGNDVGERFPEIGKTSDAVIVGEICVLNEKGLSDFNKIQQRAVSDKMKIRIRSISMPATFIAFDILESKIPIRFGQGVAAIGDFENRPLSERYKYLKQFLKQNELDRVQLIQGLAVQNADQVGRLMETMAEKGGEGFMVKNLNAPYQAKRGRNWLKIKTWQEEEFAVVKHGETGVGDGYTIFVQSGNHLQEVNCGSHEMRSRIQIGTVVELKFLSKSEDGALRFPSIRRIIK